MRTPVERAFQPILRSSRYVVLLAVIASVVAALVVFWITSVDLFYAVSHVIGYASPELGEDARKALCDSMVAASIGPVGLAPYLTHASAGGGEREPAEAGAAGERNH